MEFELNVEGPVNLEPKKTTPGVGLELELEFEVGNHPGLPSVWALNSN